MTFSGFINRGSKQWPKDEEDGLEKQPEEGESQPFHIISEVALDSTRIIVDKRYGGAVCAIASRASVVIEVIWPRPPGEKRVVSRRIWKSFGFTAPSLVPASTVTTRRRPVAFCSRGKRLTVKRRRA
jgi:hypothetical protein